MLMLAQYMYISNLWIKIVYQHHFVQYNNLYHDSFKVSFNWKHAKKKKKRTTIQYMVFFKIQESLSDRTCIVVTFYDEVIHFLINLCLGSSAWINPGFSVGLNQNPKHRLNQINTTNSAHSKKSSVVTDLDAHCETTAPSQVPTVSFDLGNEWDDWGDFDDENLVNASETPLISHTTIDKPQMQQSGEFNMPGNVKVFVERHV